MRAKIISLFSVGVDEVISDDALRITEHIIARLPFSEWDLELQTLLAVAMFPKQPMDSSGHWTPEGRASLNLIRHMIRHGHPITAPDVLKKPIEGYEYSGGIEDRAVKLRHDLLRLTKPWVLDGLF